MLQVQGWTQSHLLHPQRPPLKPGRKRLWLKLKASGNEGCFRGSRIGLLPHQGQAPLPWLVVPSLLCSLEELLTQTASPHCGSPAARATSALRMRSFFSSTLTHILWQTVTPTSQTALSFYLITFQGMWFPLGSPPGHHPSSIKLCLQCLWSHWLLAS